MYPADDTSRERRLLLVSVWASAAFAVGSSVWGLLSGSAMIVFDGLYSFVSIGLSLLAVLALRISRRGPGPDHPWGPEMWEPLVVVVKALALDRAVRVRGPGRRAAPGDRGPGGRHRLGPRLRRPGHGRAVSLVFLRVPAKLVAGGLREILSKAAPADTLAQLQACVDAVGQRFGLGESFLRAAKVGSRVDVEVDFVVGADSPVRTVADCDRVRQDLHDRLAALGYERSVLVAFTTDRKWAL